RNAQRLEGLVTAYPAVPEIRRSLAELYRLLAVYRGVGGDGDGRLRDLLRSRDVMEGMPTAPSDADLTLLCRIQSGIAETLAIQGRAAEALASWRKAVALGERLVEKNPAVNRYRINLAGSLQGLGDAQRVEGRSDEALAAFRRARSLWDEAV